MRKQGEVVGYYNIVVHTEKPTPDAAMLVKAGDRILKIYHNGSCGITNDSKRDGV